MKYNLKIHTTTGIKGKVSKEKDMKRDRTLTKPCVICNNWCWTDSFLSPPSYWTVLCNTSIFIYAIQVYLLCNTKYIYLCNTSIFIYVIQVYFYFIMQYKVYLFTYIYYVSIFNYVIQVYLFVYFKNVLNNWCVQYQDSTYFSL